MRALFLVAALALLFAGSSPVFAKKRRGKRKQKDNNKLNSMEVTVYTHEACHYCHDMKDALNAAGIVYTERALEGEGEGQFTPSPHPPNTHALTHARTHSSIRNQTPFKEPTLTFTSNLTSPILSLSLYIYIYIYATL